MQYRRDERIRKDYARLQALCQQSEGRMELKVSEEDPFLPQQYLVTFHCHGKRLLDGVVTDTDRHQVHLVLGPDYPVEPPHILWRSAIFHPNILGPHVCLLGGRWSPLTPLDEVCVWLWDMARYKLYNLDDPLNEPARQWAARYHDTGTFPLDPSVLRGEAVAPPSEAVVNTDRRRSFDELMKEIRVLDSTE